jgi:hypothetical protein
MSAAVGLEDLREGWAIEAGDVDPWYGLAGSERDDQESDNKGQDGEGGQVSSNRGARLPDVEVCTQLVGGEGAGEPEKEGGHALPDSSRDLPPVSPEPIRRATKPHTSSHPFATIVLARLGASGYGRTEVAPCELVPDAVTTWVSEVAPRPRHTLFGRSLLALPTQFNGSSGVPSTVGALGPGAW